MTENQMQLLKHIASHYGFSQQAEIAIEECAELIMTLQKLKRGKPNIDNIAEEIADVLIVAEQLKYLYGSDIIDRIIIQKLQRQIRRLNNE